MKAINNTIINSMMSNVVKYICAVVLLLGLNVNVWGGEPPSGYTKVTNISSLSTGDYVILYYPTESYGISGTASCPSYDSGTEATLSTSEGRWVQYYVTKSTTTFTLKDVSANKYVYDDSKSFRYSGTATNFSVTASGCLQSSSSGNNLLLSTVFSGRDCQRSSARFNTSGTTFYVYKVGADKNKASNNYYTVSPTSTISITVDGADGFRSGNPGNAWLLDVNVGSSLTSNINAEFTDFPSSVSDFIYPLNYSGTSNGYITNRVSGNDYVGLVYYGYSFIPNGTYSGNIHVYTTGTDTDIEYYVPLNITVINSVACTEYDISYDREGEGDEPTGDDSKCEDETVSFTPAPALGHKYNGATVYLSDLENVHTTLNANTTSFTMPNEDVYVVAHYVQQSYTIALYNQGADTGHEGTESISVTYGASTNLTGTAITLPIKTGYTFGGYYTESNGGGVQIIAANGSVNAEVTDDEEIYTSETKQWFYANDITLYAKWTPNRHTLTISSVDNVTISSSTPSVAEGSYTSVEYGSTVTLSKNSLTSGYYWGGWKVYKTDDTNTTVAVSDNQFTMPDYDVTVSAIIYPKAKLLTRCQNTVTYHYAGGTTSERVATDAHPTGYTPADCENKRFMGWSETDITVVQQSEPAMITDWNTVTVNGDLDYYAVYASPNGGKVTGAKTTAYSENFQAYTPPVTYSAGTGRKYGIWNVNYGDVTNLAEAGPNNNAKMTVPALLLQSYSGQTPSAQTAFKVHDFVGVQAYVSTKGQATTCAIQYSIDGSSWVTMKSYGGGTVSAGNKSLVTTDLLTYPVDAYVRFAMTAPLIVTSTDNRIFIDEIQIYTKSRSVWYSDYSNGCDVAGSATLTYKDIDGTTTIGTHAATPSVPEVYTVAAQTKTGYTFDYITVDGQTYAAGDKYLLAHDVDAVITWKENPTISGDVYVTAGYTNSTAQPVQSSMTVTATTTENKTGTLTIDNATGNEGGTFEAIITNGTVNNASLNATIAIKYTPTQAGVEETATMTATIDGASTNFTVHGRSLPAEFVIAAKQGNNWYALPADMSEAQNPSGKTIQVDNVSDPTVALIAQPLCRYQLYAGNNAGNIDVTKVRFNPIVTETNRNALWGSESNSAYTIRNWAAIGSGNDAHYQWSMSTTDNETYVLHLNAANGGAGRDLEISQSGSNIGKWGLYGTSSSAVIRFLPVTEEYAEAEFSVVEWYPTKVMIETNQTPTDIQSSINGGEFTAKVSPVGDGNKYVINTGTLTACYAQPLTIKYVTDAETVAKTMDIPIIISGNASASVEALVSGMSDGAYYKYTDLVVRDNSVLTIDGSNQAKNTFRNVWIMPSGKIIVPDTKRLTASSLNLFGGIDDIYNGSTYTTEKYGVPEFSLKGTLYRNSDNSLTAATYYMRTDGNQYYLLAAPSTTTINASDIKRGNTETGLTLNYDLGLLKYDGARRSRGVAGSDNWIDANTLERGLGYWIAADPIDGETYSLLRMPMTIAESDQTVAVIAHAENPSAAAVHKGWNFIANPFMTSVQTGALTFEGGTTATNFVVTPDEENYTQSFYDTHLLVAEDYQLKPFKGYFVQVGTSGNLSFGASTRQAPARMAAQDTINEVLYTVTIAGGESKSGTMGFFIAPNYTDQYDIGFDFEWMPSAGQDAYALYNNTRLRYTALPAYLAKLAIPVAYTAREAGTYTWTLNAYTNGQDLEHVYLIDYEENVTHDLLTGPYEFTTAVQTENQTRFAIATEVGEHRAPTDVETVEEDSGGGGPVKFIYHDKMYILNDNVIYDATGKRVKVVANGQKGGAL